jgi:hypothetical protein
VDLYTYQASYMIECGINIEVVETGCSSDIYYQIQVWNFVIKYIGVSLKLML